MAKGSKRQAKTRTPAGRRKLGWLTLKATFKGFGYAALYALVIATPITLSVIRHHETKTALTEELAALELWGDPEEAEGGNIAHASELASLNVGEGTTTDAVQVQEVVPRTAEMVRTELMAKPTRKAFVFFGVIGATCLMVLALLLGNRRYGVVNLHMHWGVSLALCAVLISAWAALWNGYSSNFQLFWHGLWAFVPPTIIAVWWFVKTVGNEVLRALPLFRRLFVWGLGPESARFAGMRQIAQCEMRQTREVL